ncbi:hypothetical protein YDYSY3_51700 [Paenibacillus chitinolyticus]|nr:hypothetical protein YDYSY3_51700 [Paenibacillus chitinolyticus]
MSYSGAGLGAEAKRQRTGKKAGFVSYYSRFKVLYLLSLPGIAYFLIFKYIPLHEAPNSAVCRGLARVLLPCGGGSPDLFKHIKHFVPPYK